MSSSTYTALVVGATGAIGKQLVRELVSSSSCKQVIAWTRHPLQEEKEARKEQIKRLFFNNEHDNSQQDLQAAAKTKLVLRQVDYDHLKEQDFIVGGDLAAVPVSAVFCCLGTTRKGRYCTIVCR